MNYTKLRIYGCEISPYKLPKFLTMRFFSLEYIRKILNVNEVHFVSSKTKSQFRIKTQMRPFICNNRMIGEEADELLKEIQFSLSFTWSYDPLGTISKLRVENKYTPYIHPHRPEIERYMN